ncbi:MAG TPA: SIS domain-containing protein [Candidatus Paceibacterota bacterium]|nr:SIS domain-containing protein [Candidatus Paceibacterota bacterium]
MDYKTALDSFSDQFNTHYEIVNGESLRPFKHIIIAGMGGSRLAPDMLAMLHPELSIRVHSDYDLPFISSENSKDTLIIANSHSGDTAETISAAEAALEKGLNLAIVAGGGQLAQMAEERKLPHVITPEAVGLPARLSFGYSFAAICRLLSLDSNLEISDSLKKWAEETGSKMTFVFDDKIPLIFAPRNFIEAAYVWKITLNETAKIPAYCNRLPEMDHNELAGYDRDNNLCGRFSALFIKDGGDERMNKRIKITAETLRDNGIPVEVIDIPDGKPLARAIASALAAHWTAYGLAVRRGVDPAEVPVIDQFKTAMR